MNFGFGFKISFNLSRCSMVTLCNNNLLNFRIWRGELMTRIIHCKIRIAKSPAVDNFFFALEVGGNSFVARYWKRTKKAELAPVDNFRFAKLDTGC